MFWKEVWCGEKSGSCLGLYRSRDRDHTRDQTFTPLLLWAASSLFATPGFLTTGAVAFGRVEKKKITAI